MELQKTFVYSTDMHIHTLITRINHCFISHIRGILFLKTLKALILENGQIVNKRTYWSRP